MLKTYRIIPSVFILFLFGFTLSTVAPVIAEDSPEFVACQQIKPSGDFRLMKQKKNCFRDVARLFQGQSGDSVQSVVPLETSGGGSGKVNARIEELETIVATLTTTNAQLQQQLNGSIERSAVNNAMKSMDASITELETKNASLEQQLIALSVNSAVTSSDPSVSYADQIRATIRQILPLCQSHMIDVEQMNEITGDPRRREYEGSGDERDKLYKSTLARLRSTEDVSNFCTNQVWFTRDELRKIK